MSAPYTPPTPDDLRTSFPKFAAVGDDQIASAITTAMRRVDNSWAVEDYARGIMLLACHELTLDGFGAGTEAQLLGEGVNDFQTIKLGPLNLQRFNRPAGDDGSDVLRQTSYGKRWIDLAMRNSGGPLVTGPGFFPPPGTMV